MCITATGKFNGHAPKRPSRVESRRLVRQDVAARSRWLLLAALPHRRIGFSARCHHVLADSKFAANIVVDDLEDLSRRGSPLQWLGKVLDLDHVLVHGQEQRECPFPCVYLGEDLPEWHVSPRTIGGWMTDTSQHNERTDFHVQSHLDNIPTNSCHD